MNIEELYGRLASGPREEALTLGVTGHDERANRARAELADALLAEKDRSIFPAHAGVIRSSTKSGNRRKSLPPRMRG